LRDLCWCASTIFHWAGNGTATALGSAPDRDWPDFRVGWLLAYRPDPAPRLISSTERLLEEAAKLVLAPLSDVAVAEVTADTMRAQPDDALLAMHVAPGSPYLWRVTDGPP